MYWTLELRDAMEDELGSLYQQLASLRSTKEKILMNASHLGSVYDEYLDNDLKDIHYLEKAEEFIDKKIRRRLDEHMLLRHRLLVQEKRDNGDSNDTRRPLKWITVKELLQKHPPDSHEEKV
jgi:hypothetical protein